MKIIKQLKKWIDETYNSLSILSEKTLEINDRLRAIEKVMPKEQTLYTTGGYAEIWSIDTIAESVNILRSEFVKDYFTKEYLNKEATTTKKLYVVDNDKISIEYYKVILNKKEWDKWFEYNWKEYFFNTN